MSRNHEEIWEDIGDPFTEVIDEEANPFASEAEPGGTVDLVNRMIESGTVIDARLLRDLMAIRAQARED